MGRMVGSLEECIMKGRMAAFPSRPLDGFTARLAVATPKRAPQPITVSFSPTYVSPSLPRVLLMPI